MGKTNLVAEPPFSYYTECSNDRYASFWFTVVPLIIQKSIIDSHVQKSNLLNSKFQPYSKLTSDLSQPDSLENGTAIEKGC